MTKSTPNQQEIWQQRAWAAANIDPTATFVMGIEQTWWQNPINHASLRLTSVGYKWFSSAAKIKFHEVKLSAKILPKQMLQLEKLLVNPYYIKNAETLYVFSETDAVMLQLHGGDLVTYLNNLESNQ